MIGGPERLTANLYGTLVTDLPVELARIRERLGIDERALPAPKLWCTQERPIASVNELPAVMVGLLGLTRWHVIDAERVNRIVAPGDPLPPSGAVFEGTYRCRVTVIVGADDWDATARMRDRYMAAVRAVLINNRGLSDPGRNTLVVAASITEDYYAHPDMSRWRTQREGGTEFVVQQIELQEIDALGFVDVEKLGIEVEAVAR